MDFYSTAQQVASLRGYYVYCLWEILLQLKDVVEIRSA